MTGRRQFIKTGSILSAGLLLHKTSLFAKETQVFESKRPPLAQRKFSSPHVEAAIEEIKKALPGTAIAWLFENCFPNTLDTTVDFEMLNDKPDTYVITGDIDAMWMRDSTCALNEWDNRVSLFPIFFRVCRASYP